MRGAFVTLALLSAAGLHAKGDTVRIVVRGAALSAPIEITDTAVARLFNIWEGPGTSSNAQQGFIVDWSREIPGPPNNALIFDVSFVTTRQNPGTYVVRYAIDTSTKEGYVYIPGKGDAAYRDNVWLILRGVEGRWFHASSAWQSLADPLISRAGNAR
jgi:hypothetical protein